MLKLTINLSSMTTLIVDNDRFMRGLVGQILHGFGAEPAAVASSGEEAIRMMRAHAFDLCVVEAVLPDMSGADFIRAVRTIKGGQIRFTPILVLTSYTQMHQIQDARDAGANFVARKPISPQTLYDRIVWMGHVNRPFVESLNYNGPDRRFHDVEPPDGKYNRATDGEAVGRDQDCEASALGAARGAR